MSCKNIDTIYLDMDGVLTAFDELVDRIGARKLNGKVDWQMVHELGTNFWSKMSWRTDGHLFYEMLIPFCKEHNLKIGILSAIYSNTGKAGKKEWLKRNCPEIDENLIIICNKGVEKYQHLPENGLLIDDTAINCCLCTKALYYENCNATIANLKRLFTDF